MRHLVLVRHGQSEWNAEGRVQGQSGAGLTELGRRQSEHTAIFLADSVPDARVVSSDLERCVESAAPVAERLEVEPELVSDLRERDYGAWTGLLAEDLSTHDPERFARWSAGEDVVGEVGGESSRDLEQRVLAVLEDLLEALPDGGAVVAVTHGGPVWHGTKAFLDLADGRLAGVSNASMTELVADDRAPTGRQLGRRLAAYNQIAHLPVDLRDQRHRD